MTNNNDTRREAERPAAKLGTGEPFAVAVASTRMPILLTEVGHDDHKIVYANDAFLKLTGYSREEVMGKDCLFLAGEKTDEADVSKLRTALNDGHDEIIEILSYKKDGTPFWNVIFVGPVRNGAGTLTNCFVSLVDMTEKKLAAQQLQDANRQLKNVNEGLESQITARTQDLTLALEQRTVLLHEVDHRVKNNLQLISSLILLQARRINNPEMQQSLRAMLDRVSALSTVHRRLYQSEDAGRFDVAEFIRDISTDLIAATGRDDIRLDLDMESMVISSARAAPLALITNELLTNALKHAFPQERAGVIRVFMKPLDGTLVLVVEDNGIGIDLSQMSNGFGRTVVDLLARQLSATLNWENATPGTRVRVTFPMSNILPHETDASPITGSDR